MAADGSIVFSVAIDDKQAQTELTRLTKKIDTLNAKIAKDTHTQMPLIAQSKELGAALDAAKAKLAEMQSGESFYTKSAIKNQEAAVQALQKEFDGIQSRVEKLGTSIQQDTANLAKLQAQAGELAKQLAGANGNVGIFPEAMDRADAHMSKFLGHVKTLARRVLVFSVITKALQLFKGYLWSAIQTNDDAMSAIAGLKAALMTLAQPIINVLIPAFATLVNMLTRIVTAISGVVSGLFGTTVSESAKAAETLYNEQEALEGVGSSAEKAEKSLASFDEINQLSGEAESGGSSSDSIKPDFKQVIQGSLNAIIELFTGAALLAVGAILTFSGANIPLGIALMVLGAISIYDAISTDWDSIKTMLQGTLGEIVGIVSGALLALGAILVFTGAAIPLGLGMMIFGAAGLAATAAANWGSISTLISENLNAVRIIVSAALLALGAILTFSGASVTLGIGLLISGAVGLAATAAINWTAIQTAMQGPIGAIIAMLSTALLVSGAVLLFSGAGIGLGLGMLVAGAAGLAVSIPPNWNYILEKLQAAWACIKNWWNSTVIGSLSRAKDAVVGFGHGIVEKLKDVLGIHSPSTETGAMGDYMMQGLANGITDNQSLVLAAFQMVMDNLTLSYQTWETNFMGGFNEFQTTFSESWTSFWSRMGYNFTVKWNEILSTLQTGCNNAIRALNDLVREANQLAGLTGAKYSYAKSITVSSIPLPKLAAGKVIPPNREFLAVLGDQKEGTNIETPLATMVQAFRQALAEDGRSGQNEAVMEVDGEKFGKLVYRLNKSESGRVGVDLSEA